jgi:hypothetical protein
MATEFLHGRTLESEELELIRAEIEEFGIVGAVDPELRALVARNWPHLLSTLPAEDP